MDQTQQYRDTFPARDCTGQEASTGNNEALQAPETDTVLHRHHLRGSVPAGAPPIANNLEVGSTQDKTPRPALQNGDEVLRGAGEGGGHHEVQVEDPPRNRVPFTRIPKGYSTLEQALGALSDLHLHVSTTNPRPTPRDTNVIGESISDDTSLVDPRNVGFMPDTSINNDTFAQARKKLKKMSRMLHRRHLSLLERQAEIVQLRMSVINAMMDFQAETSSIKREFDRIVKEEEGSVIDVSTSASRSYRDASPSAGQSFHDPWPHFGSAFEEPENPHCLEILPLISWDIHTIDEVQSETSDNTFPAKEETCVQQPSQPPLAAAPRDRRGDMQIYMPLTGADPIQFEPDGGRVSFSTRRHSFPPSSPWSSSSKETSQATSGKDSPEKNRSGTRSLDKSPPRWISTPSDHSMASAEDRLLEALPRLADVETCSLEIGTESDCS
jgi:hypothetical protein